MINPYSSGMNVLVVEDEEGHYEVVNVVSSVSEALELAQSDMAAREKRLLTDADPGLCPYEYYVWTRRADGYVKAETITVSDLMANYMENDFDGDDEGVEYGR